MTSRAEKAHKRAWHTFREYATHWAAAGLIIAATGTAPEEWFARAVHALHVPEDALHLWAAHVDLRAIIVFVGVAIIVGDLLWRHHGQRQVTPARELPAAVAGHASAQPTADAAPGDRRVALSLPDKPSIAVLPFANIGGNPEQEYFGDGIAEDIITMLSRSQSLFVIARNSSFTYKGRAVDVKQIARELGVRYAQVARTSRSSATGSIDNSPGGFFLH